MRCFINLIWEIISYVQADAIRDHGTGTGLLFDHAGSGSGPSGARRAGPFTVLAPTNAAFDRLPEGTVPTLLKPENQAQLAAVLKYHVLAGRYDAEDLIAAIRKAGGRATLRTVQGAPLTFSMNGGRNIAVRDVNGTVADIAVYDVAQSNGVIHVIDRVLLPS